MSAARAATALLMMAAATAAAAPAWMDEPHQVVPIHWIRSQDPGQWEVRAGVCVLYLPVTSAPTRLDLVAAEPLVRQCVSKGGLQAGAGDFDLHWYQVDGVAGMNERRDTIYPPSRPMLSPAALLRPGNVARMGETAGFYRRQGSTCLVVTRTGMASLGHELRHCYDGDWHR